MNINIDLWLQYSVQNKYSNSINLLMRTNQVASKDVFYDIKKNGLLIALVLSYLYQFFQILNKKVREKSNPDHFTVQKPTYLRRLLYYKKISCNSIFTIIFNFHLPQYLVVLVDPDYPSYDFSCSALCSYYLV